MLLTELMSKDNVKVELKSKTAVEAIHEIVNLLVQKKTITNKDVILNALLEREKQMSTGIGLGVAIPHARVEDLPEAILFIGTSKNGIEFDAIDHEKVFLVFLFVTPTTESGLHLKMLSQISYISNNDELLRFAKSATNNEDFFNYLKSLDVRKAGFRNLSVDEIFLELKTSEQGLTDEEAKLRLEKYGYNRLKKIRGKSLLVRFINNFTNLLAILMWIGAALAFLVNTPEIGWAIVAVIFINALFSFWQEFKAEKAIEALKNLLPSFARAIRNGKEEQVHTEELVPGDIVVFEEGDNISADGRLLEAHELQVDNSVFSGESHPAYKIAEPLENDVQFIWTEIPNLVFAGTSAVSGAGRAVVVSTGMTTEIGKIAYLTQSVKTELSPLQKEINRLVKVIALVALLMGGIFFVIGKFLAGISMVGAAIFAIGIILGNVPEGLMPTVTLSLAMAVQRMAKRHALIKKLSSVETLGCTNVICTDKTGTLTTNQINVKMVYLNGKQIEASGSDYEPVGVFTSNNQSYSVATGFNEDGLELFLTTSILCNTSQLKEPSATNKYWSILGDPTEAALLVLAGKAGISIDQTRAGTPLLKRFPFDSVRKSMSSIHKKQDGSIVVYVKGAPRELLDKCINITQGNAVSALTQAERDDIIAHMDNFASQGLRVLGIAYKTISEAEFNEIKVETAESNLTFLGLAAMYDPPRPEVAQAIHECRTAGIRTVMITGDYGLTAISIARQVGIVEADKGRVITGTELNEMTDAQLKTALSEDVIFARVSPEHKLRVVTAFRELGNTVAVTGDGVNDAPALKRADIGVAMGIRGTDVAKESAEMILTDDNFASIVAAIEEGRVVFENIKKFITYIFAHLVPEAIPFILYVIFKLPVPITAMQILAIDLGTETLPALALGVEKAEAGIMNEPPRPRNKGLVDKVVLLRGYVFLGLFNTVGVMFAYFWTLYQGGWHWGVQLEPNDTAFINPLHLKATTMIFAGIVVMQIANIFACRSERRSIFEVGFFHNKLIYIGIVFELVFTLALVYVPALQKIFHTASLLWSDWLLLFGLMVAVFFAEEGRKVIERRYFKKKAVEQVAKPA
jgi:potassium/sodium efflux P-type ATPase